MADNDDLRALIRTIPDFPKPGIQFRDITTLLLDADGFAASIDRLACFVEITGTGLRPRRRPDIATSVSD